LGNRFRSKWAGVQHLERPEATRSLAGGVALDQDVGLGTALAAGERRSHRADRRGLPPKPYAEYATIVGAFIGLLAFLVLLLIQQVS